MLKNIICACVFIIGISSCIEDAAGGMKIKPTAMGVLNQIAVITEEDLWEGVVRDTFEYYFESAFPIMPQPEPMFDIRQFTPSQLDAEHLRKELRTYVLLADLSDKESKSTEMIRTDLGEERYRQALEGEINSVVVRDKWARGQIIIYLMGKDRNGLCEAIRRSYPGAARRINQHDLEQLHAKIYASGINASLTNRIIEQYGIRLEIPNYYEKVPLEEKAITWLRKDDRKSNMSIMLYSFPYNNQAQLKIDSLKSKRNEMGKIISTSEANSFMVINDEDLPLYDYTYSINGKYTKEIRGIWEMNNDFMGGPFATYAILDEENNRVIVVDTFVYAPGENKRNMMQELEYIVKNATVENGSI